VRRRQRNPGEQPLVRGRTPSDRAKTPAEEPAVAVRPAEPQPTAAQASAAATAANVEKCVNCQYYDRRRARATDGKAPMWGQCRRHAPLLNPGTAKAYMVEGVWPFVRDDDWCGEWHVLTRMAEEPPAETVALAAEQAPTAASPAAPTQAPTRPRDAPAEAGASAD
jgi:hypothetical protein